MDATFANPSEAGVMRAHWRAAPLPTPGSFAL